jgi:hypothetical protein
MSGGSDGDDGELANTGPATLARVADDFLASEYSAMMKIAACMLRPHDGLN